MVYTMLETVKQAIDNLSDISFEEFYMQYVMSVQDTNIEREFSFLLDKNILDVPNMGHLIQNTYEGLVSICSTM